MRMRMRIRYAYANTQCEYAMRIRNAYTQCVYAMRIAIRNRIIRDSKSNSEEPTGLPAKKANTDNERNFNNSKYSIYTDFDFEFSSCLRVSREKRRIRITY